MVDPSLTICIFTVHSWIYFYTSNLHGNHPEGTSFGQRSKKSGCRLHYCYTFLPGAKELTADICWVHTICQTLFEILHGFGHVILTTTLWGWCYYCFLWINEVPYKTDPESPSYDVMEPGPQPRAHLSSHCIKCAILNVWGFSRSFFVKDILTKMHMNHKDEQGYTHYIGKTIALELNMVLKQFIPSLDLKIKK